MKLPLKLTFLKRLVFVLILILLCSGLSIYPYEASGYEVVSLWNPKWACGDCPDLLVIDTEKKDSTHYLGKYVYLKIKGDFWYEKGNYNEQYYDNEHKFICTGGFKKNIKMKLYEADNVFSFFSAQGVFFDATNCTPVKITVKESEYIQLLLDRETK